MSSCFPSDFCSNQRWGISQLWCSLRRPGRGHLHTNCTSLAVFAFAHAMGGCVLKLLNEHCPCIRLPLGRKAYARLHERPTRFPPERLVGGLLSFIQVYSSFGLIACSAQADSVQRCTQETAKTTTPRSSLLLTSSLEERSARGQRPTSADKNPFF